MLNRRVLTFLTAGARWKSTAAAQPRVITQASQDVFAKEDKYGAHNYHPLPVALSKAEGQFTSNASGVSLKIRLKIKSDIEME